MSYLMLFVSILYSVIFYLFDSKVGWRDLILESFIFFIIGFLFFIYFQTAHLMPKKQEEQIEFELEEEEEVSFFEKIKEKFSEEQIQETISSLSYHIWLSTFYLALFFFSRHFWIEFTYFLLFINSITFLISAIYINRKFSYKILKINSNVLSIYYAFQYILVSTWADITFGIINYTSIFILFTSFIFLLYQSWKLEIDSKQDRVLSFYFIFFIYWTLIFIFYQFLPLQSLYLSITITSIFFYFILFDFLSNIKLIKHYSIWFRILSILFLYFWMLIWNIALFSEFHLLLPFLLFLISIILYSIHFRFQNYLSFWLSFINLFTILFYFFAQKFDIYGIEFLMFVLFLSFLLIIVSIFFNFRYKTDIIFMHIMAYIINLLAVWYFFFNNGFDFFDLWVILFINSIFFFLSYKRISRLELN